MQLKDFYLIISVVVIWGINFTVIKIGLQYTTPFLFGALRFIPFLFLIFFIKKPVVPWSFLILFGVIFYFGQFALLFFGMAFGMPAGMASMVLQSQAFFTIFLAQLFLGESAKIQSFIGLVISALGLTIIGSQKDTSFTLIGLILTLAGAACWAIGNILIKRYPQTNMMSLTVWSGIVPILPFLCCAIIFDDISIIPQTWQHADWLFLFTIGYIFLLSTVYGNTIWGKLIRKYNVSTIAPFSLLVPVVGLTAASLLLQEQLSILDIVGAMVVMSGLMINILGAKLLARLKNKYQKK